MLTRVFPRLCRHASARGFCGSKAFSSRWVPISWRRPFLHDFFYDRSPVSFSKMMDDNMKMMYRFMDDMLPPRYVYGRSTGTTSKDVEVKYDNKVFEVKLNTSAFKPEDLNVKISGNNLVISGKHEDNQDAHGYVSQQFERQFLIPEDVDGESIECKITDDGTLVVSGKIKGSDDTSERIINITKESGKETP